MPPQAGWCGLSVGYDSGKTAASIEGVGIEGLLSVEASALCSIGHDGACDPEEDFVYMPRNRVRMIGIYIAQRASAVTLQTTLPTSSAIRSAPSLSCVSPTGAPNSFFSSSE